MKKAILHIINSKRDKFGNCYFGFVYTDVATGKEVLGKISGGDSNIRCAARWDLGLEWEDMNVVCTEMKIREFDRWAKDVPYAGCEPTNIAEFIKSKLAERGHIELTDEQAKKIGQKIAADFGLKKSRENSDRYVTESGDFTALGIARRAVRFIEEYLD